MSLTDVEEDASVQCRWLQLLDAVARRRRQYLLTRSFRMRQHDDITHSHHCHVLSFEAFLKCHLTS